MSEHVVQPVPYNPGHSPGAQDPTAEHDAVGSAPEANEDYAVQIGEEQPKEGAEYPESKVTDEATHKAQEEAEAKERVKRAERVTGPRRLSEREKQAIGILLSLDILKSADSVTDVVIPLDHIPEEIKKGFFDVGTERNILQRGLAVAEYGGEPKTIVGLKLTEIGMYLYAKGTSKGEKSVKQKSTKINGEPRAPGPRRSTKWTNDLRLRKMVDKNPRAEGVMGYYAWDIYRDGMNYSEYIGTKDYPEATSVRSGSKFNGPRLDHWNWDLNHGYIALYHEGENETLEDGSPNPKYWAVNNNPR